MMGSETQAALEVIASGVVVPAVTAVLTRKDTPAWVKRFLPIGLAVAGAAIVVFLRGGFTVQAAQDWLLVAAAVVGAAQTIYAAMPEKWRALREATTPDKTE